MTCISLKAILLEVQDMINDGHVIRAVTIREPQSYNTCVMVRYHEGDGIGCIGATTAMEIRYKSRMAADKTTDAINRMVKP